ncbi:MAG: ArsR/SmtB family transcription factor [Candidatus Bathycorpusculaceae bacterium]
MSYEVYFEDWRWRMIALELGSNVGKRILALLVEKPLSATEISKELKIPLSTVFYHLSRLEFLGLIESQVKFFHEKSKWTKYYRASYLRITFKIGGE